MSGCVTQGKLHVGVSGCVIQGKLHVGVPVCVIQGKLHIGVSVCVIQGEVIAELMLKHSRCNNCEDVEGFTREVAQIVKQARQLTVRLGKVCLFSVSVECDNYTLHKSMYSCSMSQCHYVTVFFPCSAEGSSHKFSKSEKS